MTRKGRFTTFWITVALLGVSPLALADHGGPESDPEVYCTGGQTVDITVELGQGLRLPREYKGSNREDTTIVGTMLSNSIFGAERIVFSMFPFRAYRG